MRFRVAVVALLFAVPSVASATTAVGLLTQLAGPVALLTVTLLCVFLMLVSGKVMGVASDLFSGIGGSIMSGVASKAGQVAHGAGSGAKAGIAGAETAAKAAAAVASGGTSAAVSTVAGAATAGAAASSAGGAAGKATVGAKVAAGAMGAIGGATRAALGIRPSMGGGGAKDSSPKPPKEAAAVAAASPRSSSTGSQAFSQPQQRLGNAEARSAAARGRKR